ncbi:hypothetical protein K438DRAFT_2016342, partial [Mycena galopus ATCC 62051]
LFPILSHLPHSKKALPKIFSLPLAPLLRLNKYGRCALSVDIIHPYTLSAVYRLINVHPESWEHAPLLYRADGDPCQPPLGA